MKAAALEYLMEEHDRFLKAGNDLLKGAMRMTLLQTELRAFGTGAVLDVAELERWTAMAVVLDDLQVAFTALTDQFTTSMTAGTMIKMMSEEDDA